MTGVVRQAFGLGFRSALVPPGAWPLRSVGDATLDLSVVAPEDARAAFSGDDSLVEGWEAQLDGQSFAARPGRLGDHLFTHGDTDAHHLSADGRVLLCGPAEPEDPRWWRIVLDSVFFTIALLRGDDALHAAGIRIGDVCVAIAGPSGAGKSTLTAALLERGAELLADDVLVCRRREGAPPVAYPGAPVMTAPAAIAVEPELVIAALDDEYWISVPVADRGLSLGAFVLLERRAGAQTALERVREPLVSIAQALLHYPHVPEREASRFHLAADVAANCLVLRLTADVDVPADELADAILSSLSRRPSRPCQDEAEQRNG